MYIPFFERGRDPTHSHRFDEIVKNIKYVEAVTRIEDSETCSLCLTPWRSAKTGRVKEGIMPEDRMFQAVELMDMAIQIEERGRAFYAACRSATNDTGLKEVFQYLMEQEVEHARVFSHMKEDLPQGRIILEDYPGELRNYLNAFVEGKVFEDPEAASGWNREINDPVEAVEAALEFEKASILFYSGMKSLVRRSEGEVVDRVMAEEQSHVRRLLSFRRKMTGGKE